MNDAPEIIEFTCSHCRARLKVKASASGQNVTCPRCNTALTVPGLSRPENVSPPNNTPPLWGRSGSLSRQPLGDPPESDGVDPMARISELSVQNRELQEKLRRKETELELARLKLAEIDRKGDDAVAEAVSPSPVEPAARHFGIGWVLIVAALTVLLVGGILLNKRNSKVSHPLPVFVALPVAPPSMVSTTVILQANTMPVGEMVSTSSARSKAVSPLIVATQAIMTSIELATPTNTDVSPNINSEPTASSVSSNSTETNP